MGLRRLTTLFAIICILAVPFADAQEAKKDPTPNYYPVELGNEWRYAVTRNGKKSTISTRITRIETIDGQKLSRLESSEIDASEHLSQTAQGVFRHRFKGIASTPPFKLLPYPASPGAKWEGEFTIEKEPGKHKYMGEIHKEEDVTVPAGKFKAIRVVLKFEEDGAPFETVYWFAKDIGFVKQTIEGPKLSQVQELEKFDRKK